MLFISLKMNVEINHTLKKWGRNHSNTMDENELVMIADNESTNGHPKVPTDNNVYPMYEEKGGGATRGTLSYASTCPVSLVSPVLCRPIW